MTPAPRTIKVSGYSKDGDIEFMDIVLPAKRIVCPLCNGTGTHVNPAIDGHGLSSEDFAEDPDFAESYFSGHYDVRCNECKGSNVIDVIDEDACRTRLSWWKGMIRFYQWEQIKQDSRMEAEYERRVGA